MKIQIKYGKEKFDLEYDLSQGFDKFKDALYLLTSVPQTKQKLTFKGTMIKSQEIFAKQKLTENCVISLMGTAEGQELKNTDKKTMFIEDMTPQQRAELLKEKLNTVLPFGLYNLGNTCYINSCVQVLRRIPEFQKYIVNQKQFPQGHGQQLCKALQLMFKQLEVEGTTVQPQMFINVFMNTFPQFNENEQGGQGFRQQDADECFQGMMQVMDQHCIYSNEENQQVSLIKDLFQIEIQNTLTNLDIEEKEIVSFEKNLKLIANIDMGIEILNQGIKQNLEGQLEKNSAVDNNTHLYKKVSQITKLPSYLCVQLSRFAWKKKDELNRTEATKTKLLRAIAFPKILDVSSFCTKELQDQLVLGKNYEKKKYEESLQKDQEQFEKYKEDLEKKGGIVEEDTKKLWKDFKAEQKEKEIKDHDDRLSMKHGQGLDTGNYELIAVLTHQGRSSDEGHYVAWAQQSGDNWVKYDDDKVSDVKIDEILNLKGGGDWHMGYYCVYRKLEVL